MSLEQGEILLDGRSVRRIGHCGLYEMHNALLQHLHCDLLALLLALLAYAMHTIVAVHLITILTSLLCCFALLLLGFHLGHQGLQVELSFAFFFIIHLIVLAVVVDTSGLCHFFNVLANLLTNLAHFCTLVGHSRMFPGHFLRLDIDVVVPSKVLIEVFFPTFWDLGFQICRLHLLDGISFVQPHLVPVCIDIPLHNGAFLTVHPSGSLALQAMDLDQSTVRELTFGNLLGIFLHLTLCDGGEHQILFLQLHNHSIVPPTFELHLVAVNIRVVAHYSDNVAIVVGLALDTQHLQQLIWFEDSIFDDFLTRCS
mmetsp:Transcript_43233/g.101696  ORF Transcript_43233/g.101696 Transcript_43233/m.101696 type:complete len:312 (+) Transcript_43233:210-1145(+)